VIANYGYEDGSGFYYVTIDGNVCTTCSEHGCVEACPQSVYAVELDDYDDQVAVVVESARKRLRELCSACRGQSEGDVSQRELPCTSACSGGALQHSW
jgi:Fe-S-cluster-containing dehydrogenase component